MKVLRHSAREVYTNFYGCHSFIQSVVCLPTHYVSAWFTVGLFVFPVHRFHTGTNSIIMMIMIIIITVIQDL